MKARIVSVLIVVVMTLILLPLAAWSNTQAEPVERVDVVKCTSLRLGTDRLEVKCTAAGIVVLDTTVPLPPGPTIHVPLPQATVTIHVQGPRTTQTIRVPVAGPTKTVTHEVAIPGPTSTVTAKPPTVTVSVNSTATTTTTPTRQVDIGGATLEPSPSETPEPSEPIISIPAPDSPTGFVIDTLVILGLVTLLLASLFSGYILGYKDADAASATFMKRLLNKK